MTMYLHALLVALSFGSPPAQALRAAPSEAVAVCPTENPQTRAMVERFMTSTSFADSRQALGLGTLTATSVRLLTDSADSATCTTLRSRVQLTPRKYPRIATYYRVGNVYVVATSQVVPPNETHIAWHPLYVLDTSFTFKTALAM
jgi:hypothetical protein